MKEKTKKYVFCSMFMCFGNDQKTRRHIDFEATDLFLALGNPEPFSRRIPFGAEQLAVG